MEGRSEGAGGSEEGSERADGGVRSEGAGPEKRGGGAGGRSEGHSPRGVTRSRDNGRRGGGPLQQGAPREIPGRAGCQWALGWGGRCGPPTRRTCQTDLDAGAVPARPGVRHLPPTIVQPRIQRRRPPARPGPAPPPPPPQGYGSGLGAGVRAGTQTPQPRRPGGGRMVEPGDRRSTRRPTLARSQTSLVRSRRLHHLRAGRPPPSPLPPPPPPGAARAPAVVPARPRARPRALRPRACVRARPRGEGRGGAGRAARLRRPPSLGRAGSGTCELGFPLPAPTRPVATSLGSRRRRSGPEPRSRGQCHGLRGCRDEAAGSRRQGCPEAGGQAVRRGSRTFALGFRHILRGNLLVDADVEVQRTELIFQVSDSR